MQILHSDFKKGIIKVLTQSLGDLWVLYNIIEPNDIVKARTFRRVVIREGEKGDRKPMVLELKVENVEFHEFSNRLRVKGQITAGPDEYVSIGQYHTINVETGTKLSITKERWYKHEINRIERSTSIDENKLLLICSVESGLATIGLISNYSLNVISTIRKNIPGKRYSKQKYNLALETFYGEVANVIIENVQKYEMELIILCGPGFFKERLQIYLKEICDKEKINLDIRALSASSGTESAIYEIIKQGEISKLVADHKISAETELMEEFVTHLGKDDGLCTYGMNDTLKAAETGAIENLLVTDIKMRTISSDDKNSMEKLFNLVESARGNVHILSTMHPAGEQLENYSGVVGLLRFKNYS